MDIVCFNAQYNDLLELVPTLTRRLKENGSLLNPVMTFHIKRTFYSGFPMTSHEDITVLTADA